jgi:hypothetical protein
VGCTYHEQCSETACNISTGACFDDSCIAEVDGDGGADFTDIMGAIGDGCVVIVHELDGATPYLEALDLSGIDVALIAAPGEEPIVQGIGNPGLRVTGGANVFVQDLRFTDATVAGVQVDGASAWFDRTEIVGNDGGGLALTNSASVSLRNSVIGGDAASGLPAIAIDSSAANILYTTAVGTGIGGQAISCTDPGAVDVRNALLFTQDATPPIACAGATVSRTAADAVLAGDDNVNVAGFMTSAFVNFGQSNFLLAPEAPAAILTAARWRSADPSAVPPRPANDPDTDINGDLRPGTDDAEDVAGADIPDL